MYVFYATSLYPSDVFKIMLEGIHYDSCWKISKKSICENKIAFDSIGVLFYTIFGYLIYYFFEELAPLSLFNLLWSDNFQIFLSLMIDKSFSQLLAIFNYVVAQVENNSWPNIIRSYFQISMSYIGEIKSPKKTIIINNIERTTFIIVQ